MKYKSLIFLHIPKTAGTTLNSIIMRQYPTETIHSIYLPTVKEATVKFKALPEKTRLGIRCLRGHMGFGLHEYLQQPSTYITFLRDPVDRIVSHYYDSLQKPGNYLHDVVTSRHMSLDEYITSGISTELANGQMLDLCSVFNKDVIRPSRDLLRVAKKNLQKHFAVVGITEMFDESVLLMRQALGWRDIFYCRHNVTQGRPSRDNIPRSTVRLIEKYNELDMELYDFAKKILLEQMRQRGAPFRYKLSLFRLMNRAYIAFGSRYVRLTTGKSRIREMVSRLLG